MRPMWEGHCLYGQGFLDGVAQGRKMEREEAEKKSE